MPQEFRDAVAQLRAARLRPEVLCEEMPAPQRIAPYAAALSADVTVDGEDVGTGRIVLLHDPAGNDTWGGTFRCVAYARAELTRDFAADPMLAEVAWTWLIEALEAHGADLRRARPGTVTKVTSESFGGDGRRGRHRPAGDPRLVDAARGHRAARRGLGRAAVHRGRARAGARRGHRPAESRAAALNAASDR